MKDFSVESDLYDVVLKCYDKRLYFSHYALSIISDVLDGKEIIVPYDSGAMNTILNMIDMLLRREMTELHQLLNDVVDFDVLVDICWKYNLNDLQQLINIHLLDCKDPHAINVIVKYEIPYLIDRVRGMLDRDFLFQLQRRGQLYLLSWETLQLLPMNLFLEFIYIWIDHPDNRAYYQLVSQHLILNAKNFKVKKKRNGTVDSSTHL